MKTRDRFLVCVLCGVLALPVLATCLEIPVAISPQVLAGGGKMKPVKGPPCITVHANVPLGEVDPDSALLVYQPPEAAEVTLEPVACFADACGDLVAKFATGTLGACLPQSETVTLTFKVKYLVGEDDWFIGTDQIIIK